MFLGKQTRIGQVISVEVLTSISPISFVNCVEHFSVVTLSLQCDTPPILDQCGRGQIIYTE